MPIKAKGLSTWTKLSWGSILVVISSFRKYILEI